MTLKNQQGFTLIELLVVTVILGLLAALALPRLAAYREQAICAQVESDVKHTVLSLEWQFAVRESYTGAPVIQSAGVVVTVNATATQIITVSGHHPGCPRGTFTFSGAIGEYAWL